MAACGSATNIPNAKTKKTAAPVLARKPAAKPQEKTIFQQLQSQHKDAVSITATSCLVTNGLYRKNLSTHQHHDILRNLNTGPLFEKL